MALTNVPTRLTAAERAVEAILRRHLDSTWLVGRRLAYSMTSVEDLFPINPGRIDRIGDADAEKIDALLFRFSSAFSIIQFDLFKSIAIAEGEDIGESSRRDIANLMEKLGAIRSSEEITRLWQLHSVVAQIHHKDPEKQAEVMNEIHENVAVILGVMRDLSDYVARKNLLANPPTFRLDF